MSKNKSQTKKTKKVTTLVVYKAKRNSQRAAKPRSKRSRGRGPNFAYLIHHPFDPLTEGIQVPDEWSTPTCAFKLKGTYVMTNQVANGAVLFFPSPLLSAVDLVRLSGGTTNLSSLSASSFTNSPSFRHAATQASLAAVLATFRVVAWGIRITNLQPMNTITGRFAIAKIPISSEIPPYEAFENNNVGTGVIEMMTGCSLGALVSANVLDLPGAEFTSATTLLRAAVECAGTSNSPSIFNMKNTGSQHTLNATLNIGDDNAYTLATGAIAPFTYGWHDAVDMTGQNAIVFYYDGMPLTTSNFEFEYIYHLEGCPQLGTAGNVPVPSGSQSARSFVPGEVGRAIHDNGLKPVASLVPNEFFSDPYAAVQRGVDMTGALYGGYRQLNNMMRGNRGSNALVPY